MNDNTNWVLFLIIVILLISFANVSYRLALSEKQNKDLRGDLAQKNLSGPDGCTENCWLGYNYANMMLANYKFNIRDELISINLSADSIGYCIDQCRGK